MHDIPDARAKWRIYRYTGVTGWIYCMIPAQIDLTVVTYSKRAPVSANTTSKDVLMKFPFKTHACQIFY